MKQDCSLEGARSVGEPEKFQALRNLQAVLEAQLPINPESPVNELHRKRIERIMSSYFSRLEKAMPWGEIERIYNRHVEK